MSDFWVFGYGSLMWNPGFDFQDRQIARLHGYHRALCIYSTHYRGTDHDPGLVMGLKRGGSCLGVAFHVDSNHAEATLDYLRAREQISGVYEERFSPLKLRDGRHIKALSYVARPNHPQYAATIDLDQMVDIVRTAHGVGGPNIDYVVNTVQHLRQLNIQDKNLETILRYITSDNLPDPK